MPKMLAFIDGSIYSDSVCDHVIWAADGDQSDVSLFNVIEGAYEVDAPSNFSGNLGAIDRRRHGLGTLKMRFCIAVG